MTTVYDHNEFYLTCLTSIITKMKAKIWEYNGIDKVPIDVTNVKVRDGVELIPERAFQYCSRLVSIDIPDSVRMIGSGAFHFCTSLQSIKLPPLIRYIEYITFRDCRSLRSVQLFNSQLTEIGTYAFYNCTSLKSINFPPALKYIYLYAFSGCVALTTLKLPPYISYMGDRSFCDCTSLTSILIPNVSCSIQKNSFEGCTSVTSIQFENPRTDSFFGDKELKFLVDIIKCCPQIAKRACIDKSFLPLHFVLTTNLRYKYEEVDIIVKAYPEALSIPDPKFHLYPFLLAACSFSQISAWSYLDNELEIFECVYNLLREAPWALCFLIERK